MAMLTCQLSLTQIYEGAQLLKAGKVIGFPTETVYGLAVIYDDRNAYESLMNVKRRPPQKPFTLMCSNLDEIAHYAVVDEHILSFLRSYMPGALTVLLPKRSDLPEWVTLDSDYVGIRISSLSFVRELIRQTGKPLLVPSANRSNKPPLSHFNDVKEEFDGEVAALYQADAQGDSPSTIIKIDHHNIYLIREGNIPFHEIERKWKEK